MASIGISPWTEGGWPALGTVAKRLRFHFPVTCVVALTAAILTLVLASALRRAVVRYIHYQRVREVLWVLETAYVADSISPGVADVSASPGIVLSAGFPATGRAASASRPPAP